MKKRLLIIGVTLAVLGAAGYGVVRFSKVAMASTGTSEIVPTTRYADRCTRATNMRRRSWGVEIPNAGRERVQPLNSARHADAVAPSAGNEHSM